MKTIEAQCIRWYEHPEELYVKKDEIDKELKLRQSVFLLIGLCTGFAMATILFYGALYGRG